MYLNKASLHHVSELASTLVLVSASLFDDPSLGEHVDEVLVLDLRGRDKIVSLVYPPAFEGFKNEHRRVGVEW